MLFKFIKEKMASSSEALFHPSKYVLRVLKEAEDPLEAIESVQSENKVKIPSIHSALSLLDLHGITREETHRSLFNSLQENLRERLSSLDSKNIKRLLDKAFQYTSVPEICSVIMKVLESLSAQQPIDEKCRKEERKREREKGRGEAEFRESTIQFTFSLSSSDIC